MNDPLSSTKPTTTTLYCHPLSVLHSDSLYYVALKFTNQIILTKIIIRWNTHLPSTSWSCRSPAMTADLLTLDRSSPSMTRDSKAVYVIAMCPLSHNTGDSRAYNTNNMHCLNTAALIHNSVISQHCHTNKRSTLIHLCMHYTSLSAAFQTQTETYILQNYQNWSFLAVNKPNIYPFYSVY